MGSIACLGVYALEAYGIFNVAFLVLTGGAVGRILLRACFLWQVGEIVGRRSLVDITCSRFLRKLL